MKTIRIALLCGLCVLLGAPAFGQRQEPARPSARDNTPLPEVVLPPGATSYGRLEAGNEAYLRGEAGRRDAIQRQSRVQDDMLWYYGQPATPANPPGLEAAYAGPRWSAPPIFGPVRAYRQYLGLFPVFEPWPFVPNDIYGSPYLGRVQQPLGHQVTPTGPNGYIYRPFYGKELGSKVAPAEESPVLVSEAEPIPAPVPESGPREF